MASRLCSPQSSWDRRVAKKEKKKGHTSARCQTIQPISIHLPCSIVVYWVWRQRHTELENKINKSAEPMLHSNEKEKTVYRLPHWWHFICFLIGYYSCYYSRIRPPLVFCFFSLYCYNLDVHWLCDPRLVSIPEARGLFRPDVDVHQKPLNSITSFSHQTEQRICCSKKLQSLMPLQTNIKEALHIFFSRCFPRGNGPAFFFRLFFYFISQYEERMRK